LRRIFWPPALMLTKRDFSHIGAPPIAKRPIMADRFPPYVCLR